MKISNFYTEDELLCLGFKSLGTNVKISKKSSLYGTERMSIGSNVRIEDFCVLNGDITIGNNVFIAVFCLLDGHAGITIEDDVAIAAKVSIHSGSDDYSGKSLVGSYIPAKNRLFRIDKKVIIRQHSIIGDSSVLMPGVELAEGTAVGAMSFVKKSTEPFGIYVGVPAQKIKNRSKDCLVQYEDFMKKSHNEK